LIILLLFDQAKRRRKGGQSKFESLEPNITGRLPKRRGLPRRAGTRSRSDPQKLKVVEGNYAGIISGVHIKSHYEKLKFIWTGILKVDGAGHKAGRV